MIGIDIVKISRIETLLQRYPQKTLTRLLCKEEIALAKTPQTIAGFYAAKEAVAKALGTGIGPSCSFKDIRIHKSSNGAPYFTLTASIIKRYQIIDSALSITHDGDFAIAVASLMTTTPLPKQLCH